MGIFPETSVRCRGLTVWSKEGIMQGTPVVRAMEQECGVSPKSLQSSRIALMMSSLQ